MLCVGAATSQLTAVTWKTPFKSVEVYASCMSSCVVIVEVSLLPSQELQTIVATVLMC